MTKKPKPGAVTTPDPQQAAERLRCVGGSRVDGFNQVIAGQAAQSLWLGHAKTDDAIQTQVAAVAAALMGIGPRDEVEGMLAAQLVACLPQRRDGVLPAGHDREPDAPWAGCGAPARREAVPHLCDAP